MKWACVFLLEVALLAVGAKTLSKMEAQDGWLLLFDGKSLFGWTQGADEHWRVVEEALNSRGDTLLRSTTQFSDFVLTFDFRSSDVDRTATLFLRIARDTPHETGYQIQLCNDDPRWPAGSIVSVAKSDGLALASNQWHSAEVSAIGDRISVKLDNMKVAEAKDARSKAGFIGFRGSAGARLELRDVKLKPAGLQALFNGSDLSGWKSVGVPPPKPDEGGILKRVEKVFKVRSGKGKETLWTVQQNGIHAEKGPGQLETSGTYADFLLQAEARIGPPDKSKRYKTSIRVRGDSGQLFSGYEIQTDSVNLGGIAGLKAPRKIVGGNGDFVLETIAVSGRHFAIWVNGYPVTEFDDTRPEAATPAKGARIAAGPVSLAAPGWDSEVDFRTVRLAVLPNVLAREAASVAAAPSAAPAPAASSTAVALPPPPQPAVMPAITPQQMTGQADRRNEESRRTDIARLMQEALRSSDPNQQKELYGRVIALDPSNTLAGQGFKEAQQKLDETSAQRQRRLEEEAKETEQADRRQANGSAALARGERAFLARDFAQASSQLSIAERLLPGNPQVQALRSRLNSVFYARQRLRYIASGGGLMVLLVSIAAFWRARGRRRPYLEVVEGIDKGKRFNLDQEVNHVGAVPQDGAARNEIVLKDIERMISRFHCEIHNRNGKLFVVDCNSSNGTSVDGTRVAVGKPVRLRNGSRVGLGKTCRLRVGYEKRN